MAKILKGEGRFGNNGGEEPPKEDGQDLRNEEDKELTSKGRFRIDEYEVFEVERMALRRYRGVSESVIRNKIGERLKEIEKIDDEQVINRIKTHAIIESHPAIYLALIFEARRRGLVFPRTGEQRVHIDLGAYESEILEKLRKFTGGKKLATTYKKADILKFPDKPDKKEE